MPTETTPHILSETHRAMLQEGSGLPQALIAQRGYESVTSATVIKERGFSTSQSAQVPCLAIPLWTVQGQQKGWMMRPDHPRPDKQGKPRKYETPYGAKLTLDCHPSIQGKISDPSIPLWITEGVKKGDALASHGCCAIDLPGGVWGFRSTNETGGKVFCPDWGYVALNGRDVYVVYDNDVMRKKEVRQALAAIVSFLKSRDARPHVVLLPDVEEKLGVDDWLVQGHTIGELIGLAGDAVPDTAPVPRDKNLPTIEQEPSLLPEILEQAELALTHMPDAPHIFQRTRFLVSIAPPEKQAPHIKRDGEASIMSPMDIPRLRTLLARAANWYSRSPRTSKLYADAPSFLVVSHLLAQNSWEHIPPLTGIAHTPTLRPDGSLIQTQGYDPDTGLWLTWDGYFPAIHDTPSREDACKALRVLCEPFVDFPFAGPQHLFAVIAAILTLIARYAVENVPLFAINATTRGSGKGLLADCIGMIAIGRKPAKMPPAEDKEEERKRLLSIALDGDSLVVIDNVVGTIGSPSLDSILTSSAIKDRLLGKNSNKSAIVEAVFIATGNNMRYRGDLARRVLPINLAPMMERPETRTNFAHSPLVDWVRQERPRFVAAALTILRAYFVAGKPKQDIEQWGSFEIWSDVVRSALVWCGAPDPCLEHETLEATNDDGFDAHAELLNAWHAVYGETSMSLSEIVGDLQMHTTPDGHKGQREESWEKYDRLRESLGAFDEKFDGIRLNSKRIGRAMRHLIGRVIDDKQLKKEDKRSENGTRWTVKKPQQDLNGKSCITDFPVLLREIESKIQDNLKNGYTDFQENTHVNTVEEINTVNTGNTGNGRREPGEDAEEISF